MGLFAAVRLLKAIEVSCSAAPVLGRTLARGGGRMGSADDAVCSSRSGTARRPHAGRPLRGGQGAPPPGVAAHEFALPCSSRVTGGFVHRAVVCMDCIIVLMAALFSLVCVFECTASRDLSSLHALAFYAPPPRSSSNNIIPCSARLHVAEADGRRSGVRRKPRVCVVPRFPRALVSFSAACCSLLFLLSLQGLPIRPRAVPCAPPARTGW